MRSWGGAAGLQRSQRRVMEEGGGYVWRCWEVFGPAGHVVVQVYSSSLYVYIVRLVMNWEAELFVSSL